MDFVNATAAVAELVVTDVDASGDRMGFVVAKTTYDFGPGWIELDTQGPFAIFGEDVETELGLLPEDTVPRHDPAVEVIVLGAAHAPEDRPVTQRTVSVEIGPQVRSLLVSGDRCWDEASGSPVISEPAPFERMPLTWSRAFGGAALVEVDDGAFLEITHDLNPSGRGVDLAERVAATAAWLRPPPGYPVWSRDARLPNLESPQDRIHARSDSPTPRCWATVENGSPMGIVRMLERLKKGVVIDPTDAVVEALHRAAPDMIFEAFVPGPVKLTGLAAGAPIAFPFPAPVLELDYRVDDRAGKLPLRLQNCVLLPEERRMYLVHRAGFRLAERSRAEARLAMR